MKLKRTFLILASLLMLVSISPASQVSALSPAMQDFYSQNNIQPFYDPEAASAICSSDGTRLNQVSGNTNAERIWNWLTSQGLTANQTAGVMGNIARESSYSPTRQEDSKNWPSGGYGIVQWTFGRRDNLVNSLPSDLKNIYDPKYGGPPGEDGKHPDISEADNAALLAYELNYMMQESMGRTVSNTVASQGYGEAGAVEWDTLKQQQTLEDAVVFWHNNFEVSADSPEEVLEGRLNFAKEALNQFGGSSTNGGCSPNASINGSTIISTINNLAWHHSTVGESLNTDATDAYQIAANKYWGDGYGPNAYADCTYFVATTMRESGIDPDFPIGTIAISNYFRENDGTKYQLITDPSFSDLQPGDIIQHTNGGTVGGHGTYSGHIMFYTGPQTGDDGNEYYGADASKYTRVPGYITRSSVEGMFTKSTVVIARPIVNE